MSMLLILRTKLGCSIVVLSLRPQEWLMARKGRDTPWPIGAAVDILQGIYFDVSVASNSTSLKSLCHPRSIARHPCWGLCSFFKPSTNDLGRLFFGRWGILLCAARHSTECCDNEATCSHFISPGIPCCLLSIACSYTIGIEDTRQTLCWQESSKRSWNLPSLEEVKAEGQKLAASGFTTVSTPSLSESSRQAVLQQRRVRQLCLGQHHCGLLRPWFSLKSTMSARVQANKMQKGS